MITPAQPCQGCLNLSQRLREATARADRLESALTAYVRAHELMHRKIDTHVIAFDQAKKLTLIAWEVA